MNIRCYDVRDANAALSLIAGCWAGRMGGVGQGQPKPKETAKAAQAWADYLALGPGRSLEKLEEKYRTDAKGAPYPHLSRLKIWSTENEWQDRLKELAAGQVSEVVELERAILLVGTRELHRRYGSETTVTGSRTDELLSVLGHVRPKESNFNLGGTIVVRIVGADVEAI